MPSTQKNRPASKTRYEYKPPKAEMRATQPNPILEGISSGLGSFRGFLDKLGNAKYPLPPGMLGAGHMLVGTAPEEVHEWASGFSPFSEEPNLGNRLDPRIKPGREQGVVDVGLLGTDVAGLGLAGLRGGVRAVYPTLNPEMNVGRREFLGNTGKIAAAAAVPGVLRGVEHAAPRIADNVAAHTAAIKKATAEEYRWALHEAEDQARKDFYASAKPEELSGSYDKLLEREQLIRQKAHAAVRADPRFAEHAHLKTPQEIVEEWGTVHRKHPNVHTLRSPQPTKWIQDKIDAGNMAPLLPNDKLYLKHMGLGDLPTRDVYLPNNYRAGGRVRMI